MKSTITISDKAVAMNALYMELQDIERLQLEAGEQVAALLLAQVRLAEKSRALMTTMKSMVK